MSNKYFDFDQAMSERNREPMIVKAFGKEYSLPGELPFEIVLNMIRSKKDKEDEVSEQEMIEMAITLFGQETFDEWIKNRISLSGIMVMIEGVMSMYMSRAQETHENVNGDTNSNP